MIRRVLTSVRRQAGCLAALLLAGAGLAAQAQDSSAELRASLFAEADRAVEAAKAANAPVLAPDNYEKAMDLYRDADQSLRRGGNLDAIKADLLQATGYLQQAQKATELARVTLTSAIEARADAESADAATHASELWKDAEKEMRSAATRLEDGNVNRARRAATDAEKLYRDAELAAIKSNYLDEARRLLAQAEDQRAERYAPRTFKHATELLTQAERELNTNRYDTDYPRSLAQQAKHEALHALYIAEVADRERRGELSVEDIILDWETPVVDLAALLDQQTTFDDGYESAMKPLLASVETLRTEHETLTQQNAAFERQVAELQEELGGTSRQVQLQEQRRQQLAKTRSLFTDDEARIVQEAGSVIIRLTGLSFDSGKSVIEPRYFGLLRKVQEAIRNFPDAQIVIEGHTDSFGSDATNLTLSDARASAVREYLVANMDLITGAVEAIGYGEARPIANNETADGRARNRRIDVVIQPAPMSAQASTAEPSQP